MWKEAITVLALATLGPGAAAAQTSPATSRPNASAAVLIVRSEPAGAIVRVDGEAAGVTELQYVVEAGVHTITIEHDGYLKESRRVEVSDKTPTTLDFSLERDRTAWKWTAGGVSLACIVTGIWLIAKGDAIEYAPNGDQPRQMTRYGPAGYTLLGVGAAGAAVVGYWWYHDAHQVTVAGGPNAAGGWSFAVAGRF
jgi:PEGA domain